MMFNMKKLILRFLEGYKRFLSSLLPVLYLIFPVACKFHPTCSAYAWTAINRYGLIKGVWLGFKRIFRCHPFHQGGLDLVP